MVCDSLANLLSIRLSDLLAASWRSVYRFLWLSVGEQSVISPLILLTISLLIPMAISLVACLVIGAALGAIDLGGGRGLRLQIRENRAFEL